MGISLPGSSTSHGRGVVQPKLKIIKQTPVDVDADAAAAVAEADSELAAGMAHKFTPLPPVVRTHDIFNLFAIAALNALNFAFLASYIDGEPLLYASMAYFLIDMLYVGLFPRCVKSPEVILVHHIVSMGLILIPFHYPKYTWCLASCMLVEINTWLLIAKRTIPYGLPVMEVLFYATWVLLRNAWYPYLCYVFYHEWRAESQQQGTPWNAILITPVFQALLTCLNYYWTFQLLLKTRGQKMKQL